jgi:putative membrane protein
VISKKTAVRAGASFFAVPAALVMAAGPSLAAGGDVIVTNTETVQAYLSATGRLDVARVYDQLALKGKGKVSVSNPVETKGLRNLDSFGGFEVKDGNVVGTYEVDGEQRLRTVSDFTKSLPLDVHVSYTLDGKEVKPGDVVGKSGLLKVQYTVRNVTGKPQEVSFDDGTGKTVTATEDVVIPMVGSLSTVLPPSFTDVRSGEANMAGDGRGGTKMSFTMTLFGPIGKPEATFGYEAQISDGVIPKASISALPVSPLDSPSFKGGAESYKGGAETGATLTAGASEIDANLLKLRDGAGDLLAGLIQLRDGANQLNAGLSGEAAPGAKKLADGANQAAAGAGELSNGVGQLDDGAQKLSAGSKELAGGTGQLADGAGAAKAGSGKVADGAGQVASGSADLAAGAGTLAAGSGDLEAGAADLAEGIALILKGVEGLPATVAEEADFKRLKGALTSIQDGIGKPDDVGETTLLGGLNLLNYGLRSPMGVDDCDQDAEGSPQDDCGAADGVEIIAGRLSDAGPKIEQLKQAAVGAYLQSGCPQNAAVPVPPVVPPTNLPAGINQVCVYTANVVYGLAIPAGISPASPDGGLKQQTELAATKLTAIFQGVDARALPGIAKIKRGLSNPGCDATVTDKTDPKYCGVAQAAGLISDGVDELVQSIADELTEALEQASDGADKVAAGAAAVASGSELVAGGAGQLANGSGALAEGANQLNAGLGDLSAGADKVDAGANKLSDGAGQLADGTGKASDGAGKLADGNKQIADGANQLSAGLGDAADGSGQIADGLEKAADGAPQLKDGAQRLSDEGTKKLVEAGMSTAADYGQKYALIEAGAQRAKAEGMAYGAPADAAGNTAYSYELAGMTGEGSRNMGRGLGAAAVFGLAGAGAFLRRKFI